jgi:hypothetical protein
VFGKVQKPLRAGFLKGTVSVMGIWKVIQVKNRTEQGTNLLILKLRYFPILSTVPYLPPSSPPSFSNKRSLAGRSCNT